VLTPRLSSGERGSRSRTRMLVTLGLASARVDMKIDFGERSLEPRQRRLLMEVPLNRRERPP
jgi:hypothetical protein